MKVGNGSFEKRLASLKVTFFVVCGSELYCVIVRLGTQVTHLASFSTIMQEISSYFFFLEHAGELRIIILIEEKKSYIDPRHPHTHNATPAN